MLIPTFITSNKILVKLFSWIRLYSNRCEKYKYIKGATVFPKQNVHLVKIPNTTSLHETFFNAWSEITIEEGVVLGHQVMFLAGKHDIKNGCVEKEANSAGNPAHFIKKLN